MEIYKDIDGDSGITGYEKGKEHIIVQFSDGAVYQYTNESAGKANIERMKILAQNGEGLNAYINKNTKEKYAARLK
jgi:hypothetical protein